MSNHHFRSQSEIITNGNHNGTSLPLHQPSLLHQQAGATSGSIIRIHSDSQQSLDRLFNPTINETPSVPLRQRKLPSSFFNPSSSSINRLGELPEQRPASLHTRSTSFNVPINGGPNSTNRLHMRTQSVLAPMTGLSNPMSSTIPEAPIVPAIQTQQLADSNGPDCPITMLQVAPQFPEYASQQTQASDLMFFEAPQAYVELEPEGSIAISPDAQSPYQQQQQQSAPSLHDTLPSQLLATPHQQHEQSQSIHQEPSYSYNAFYN